MILHLLHRIKLLKNKWRTVYWLCRISLLSICLFVLLWFCLESNKVQIQDYSIHVDTEDVILLDSLKIRFEYPNSERGGNRTKMTIVQVLRGSRLDLNAPRRYYLKDGYMVDSVYGRLRTDVQVKVNGHSLTDSKINTVKMQNTCISYSGKKGNNAELLFAEFFFLQSAKEASSEQFSLTSEYAVGYKLGFFSRYNLQKRCLSLKINTTLSKDRVKLEIDFKDPINIHTLSTAPDKQGFTKLVFNQEETVSSLCSNGFSAIVETMSYEGIQTTRNILIGILIPFLISKIYKVLRKGRS